MKRLLKTGMRNDSVIVLQAALRNVGLYKYKIDGHFGKLTYQALVAFQKAAGLKADGIVGDKTWYALNSATQVLSGKIIYLMWHTTASPFHVYVDKAFIERVHMGPRAVVDGRYWYKGSLYQNFESLPNEKVGGVRIQLLQGRGWSKPGYSKIVKNDAVVETIVETNQNDYVEAWEVTYGALGFNYNCIHLVYAGGTDKTGKFPLDTRTTEQKRVMAELTKEYIKEYPWIKVLGHNQVANKACPCFDVPEWCRKIGIKESNIF